MRTVVIAFATVTCLYGIADANPMKAGLLQEICQQDRRLCSFYVMGVFEGSVMAGDPETQCVPGNVSYDQMTSLVTAGLKVFAKQHPDWKNKPAVSAVSGIITGMYPCQQGNKR
jgi:hypothetical protein